MPGYGASRATFFHLRSGRSGIFGSGHPAGIRTEFNRAAAAAGHERIADAGFPYAKVNANSSTGSGGPRDLRLGMPLHVQPKDPPGPIRNEHGVKMITGKPMLLSATALRRRVCPGRTILRMPLLDEPGRVSAKASRRLRPRAGAQDVSHKSSQRVQKRAQLVRFSARASTIEGASHGLEPDRFSYRVAIPSVRRRGRQEGHA